MSIDSSSPSIEIIGATGTNASKINGIYDISDDKWDNNYFYKRRTDNSVILVYDTKVSKWKVKRSDLKGKTIAKYVSNPLVRPDVQFNDHFDNQVKANNENDDRGLVDNAVSNTNNKIVWSIKDGILRERYFQSTNVTIKISV